MIDPADLVLIAILNNRRDFEVIRLLGWYRIPLRFAPKIVDVDAIAFYQTAKFKEEKWSIRYAAKVCGVELVKRTDLFQEEADHPRAREEYYKLQLGPLEVLPHPIVSRSWKRLTFLYTTGERLMNATEIGGLALNGTDRRIFWRALRERGYCFPTEDPKAEAIPWTDAIEAFMKSKKTYKGKSEVREK